MERLAERLCVRIILLTKSQEYPMSQLPEKNEHTSGNEPSQPVVSRRSFVTKGAAMAAGALAGASVVGTTQSAKAAAQEGDCRSMQVTMQYQGFGDMNPRQILENFGQGGELLQEAIRNCPEKGGFGEWNRDASGDTEIRSIGFHHMPFRP